MVKNGRKTTLKDVAEKCGVSLMAVSKILNGKGGASKKTAELIIQTAREMNYTPNLVAKSLRVNATKTLGVIFSDTSQLLFAKLLKGIEDAAAEHGYNIIIANTNQSPERERDSTLVFVNKRIDGLLLAAPINTDDQSILTNLGYGIPLALLMRFTQLPVDTVISDNYHGSYEIVDYLIRTGSRRIYFLNMPKWSMNGEERRKGYRQALLDNGLAYDEKLIRNLPPQIEDGVSAMRDLLKKGFDGDAIFCGCDMIAVGVMHAATEAGIEVPGQLRIAGYDDVDMLDYLRVPITTMRQRVYEMGREGVRLVLRRINKPDAEPVQTVLPCELIIRKST